MTEAERRRANRYAVIFPLEVDCAERKRRLAISRNTSATGMLFASRSRFEIGDVLHMRLLLPGQEGSQCARGHVVRREPETGADFWPHEMAVEFDPHLEILEPILREHAA